jgi:hypothetical protein
MKTTRRCTRCGRFVPRDITGDLCLACLRGVAAATVDTAPADPAPPPAPFLEPPAAPQPTPHNITAGAVVIPRPSDIHRDRFPPPQPPQPPPPLQPPPRPPQPLHTLHAPQSSSPPPPATPLAVRSSTQPVAGRQVRPSADPAHDEADVPPIWIVGVVVALAVAMLLLSLLLNL